LGAWPIGAVRSLAEPPSGAINRTLLVAAERGDYVLRGYRHRERGPVEREHALIAYARERGVPAVAPLPLPGGGTILERGGRFYALFPRAPGRQIDRAELDPAAAAAMGRALAELHRALACYPLAQVASRSFAVDRAATLAGLARLEAAVVAAAAPEPIDQHVLRQLRERRGWLDRAAPPAGALEEHPWQAIHGDYQETNLFFAGGAVSAIIDWDQAYAAPRAWEVVRALHLALRFIPALCDAFLAGYRAALPLPDAELDHVAAHYCWLRAHDLWMYNAIYVERDERLRRFLEPGGFVPLSERWAAWRK
jgi:homoserine kinase type II